MASSAPLTILLTGGTSGIGLEAVKVLAVLRPDAQIIATGRVRPLTWQQSSLPPGLPSNVKFAKLDLCSKASVRDFVAGWSYGPISHFVMNAGGGFTAKPVFTADGIEETFAACHTGHALLFFLLNDAHLLRDDCSIIANISEMHNPDVAMHPKQAWVGPAKVAAADDPRLADMQVRYGTAKLGVVFFMWGLERRAKAAGKGWRINCFEPGFAPGTGLARQVSAPLRFVANYILPHLTFIWRMAGATISTPPYSGKRLAEFTVGDEYATWHGRYLLLDKEKKTSVESYDVAKQDELWAWTVETMAKDPQEAERFDGLR